MKRFALPVMAAFLMIALISVPALAEPIAAPAAARPAGTASPRHWDEITSNGELLDKAVKADSAILMDEKTGTVLYQKEPDKKQFPASITKIMTCLLAVEYIEDGHKVSELVTVGVLPPMENTGRMGLKKGETLPLETLLYGLMLYSANDAANVIAIHIAGSVDAFVEMMNKKAQDLGMTGTHYVTANGLHDPDHYTTARDMATLTREARKYPLFTKIVSTYTYTAPATNVHPSWKWTNHNKLISTSKNEPYGYIYATGVKTGFTTPAKRTLVSSAKNGGMSLIGVVFYEKEPDDWTDSVTMLEYGFQFYDTLDLRQLLVDQTITLEVKNAAGSDPGMGKLQLLLRPKTANPYITERKEIIQALKDDPTQFVASTSFTKDTAPIAQDEVLGTVTFTYKEQAVLECDLLAAREVKEMPTPAPTPTIASTGNASNAVDPTEQTATPSGTASPDKNDSGPSSALVWAGVAILALLFAVVTIRLINIRRRNLKYRQYNYRQGGGTRMRR